jgi:hypothetical protein
MSKYYHFIARLVLLVTSFFVLAQSTAQAQVINTIAGNGSYAFGGDGGPATLASFNSNEGIAVDTTGNLYIADYYNARIRLVNTTGIINTFAGNGMLGNDGDGGPATAAKVGTPWSVAGTNAGIGICENDNYIRLVNPANIINVIAGNGMPATTGDGGPAINAQVQSPITITADPAGNIYFANDFSRIRKINTLGIISTVVGTGVAGFSGDGGLATLAQISAPRGIAVDDAGNIYISDYDSSRIRKVDPSGIINTIAGTGVAGFSGDGGPAALAKIHHPTGIVVDGAGNVYFSDYHNYRIRKIDLSGIITTVAGSGTPGFSGDGGPALLANMYPGPLALDKEGNIIESDIARVRKICIGSVISITVSPQDTICSGSMLTFTALTPDPAPGFQWFKNNTPVGNNSSIYTTQSLANGDVIKCVLTSGSLGCTLLPTDTSNLVTVVIDTIPPLVTITATPGTVITQNQSVTFTAAVTNAANPQYQWKKNGNDVIGATQQSYTTAALSTGDMITCRVHDLLPCDTFTSAPLTMTVWPLTVQQLSPGATYCQVYPNPVKDLLYIEYAGLTGGQFELTDMAGRILASQPLSNTFDAGSLKPGAYLLHVTSPGHPTFSKMIFKQ